MSEQQGTTEMLRTFTGMAYELHPELLKKAWRGGVMRVAKRLKEQILADFAATKPATNNPKLDVTARKAFGAIYLYKGDSGFAITTYSHRPDAMTEINTYKRKRDGAIVKGRDAPLIHWLEHGSFKSQPRETRMKIGRKPHKTGILPALELLAKEEIRSFSQVESEISDAIDEVAQKIVKKYGF